MSTSHPEPPNPPSSEAHQGRRLESWKEIAQFLNRDVRTVQRWEQTGKLPVRRHVQEGLKRGSVYAYEAELEAWRRPDPPASPSPEAETPRRSRRVLVVAVAVGVALVACIAAWRFLPSGPPPPQLRVVQLTSYPGVEGQPAFSPDGTQIAFSWNGAKQDNFDVYVKPVAGGPPRRLTTDRSFDGRPAWSPDGRWIAFDRWSRGRPATEVFIVPAGGGPERKVWGFVARFDRDPKQPGLSWTPDSRWLVAPRTLAGSPTALALVSLGTLESRPLTRPAADTVGDCCPTLSKDGRTLAFLRASKEGVWNVYLQTLTDAYEAQGEPRKLTSEPGGAWYPMWTGDGKEILYRASRQGTWMLWRIPKDGSGRPAPVASVGPIGSHWSISRKGDRLAYRNNAPQTEIWRLGLKDGKSLERVVSATAIDFDPQYSPDGTRIAYVSRWLDELRVTVSDSDGANPMQLAMTVGPEAGPPRWSPDGSQIAYECQNDGNHDVCAVPSGGGNSRRLTRHPAADFLPNWSHDGKSLYVTSTRSGSHQIWKIPADGSESGAVQLTSGGGFAPVASPDGKLIYYAKERFAGAVWAVPASGGKEIPVGSVRVMGRPQDFAVSPEGIYYAASANAEQSFDIWLYRFSTARAEQVTHVEKRLTDGLSVSPDGRYLLFPAFQDQFADLYMVENFR